MGVNKNRICVNYLRKRVYTFGHQSQPFGEMSQFPQRTKSTFLGIVTHIVITLTLTLTKYARTWCRERGVNKKLLYILIYIIK